MFVTMKKNADIRLLIKTRIFFNEKQLRMKMNYLKQVLLAGVAAVTMSGCVDSNDPDFQITGLIANVVQKNYGPDQVNKQFGTYVAVGASYGTVESASLRKNGMPFMYFGKLGDNRYETRLLEWSPSIGSVNGNYVVSMSSVEGETIQHSFKVNIDKTLGALVITEPLKYESGKITAKWQEVENATEYGILVGVGVKDQTSGTTKFYRINSGYYKWDTNAEKTSGSFTPLYAINGMQQGMELIVAVVAAYSTTNEGALFLEGDYYKIVVGRDGITPITGFN